MLFSSSIDTKLVCCTSTNEVQRAIDVYCNKTDTVLELGADLGEVSKHICRRITDGKIVFVDKKRSESKTGRCKFRDTENSEFSADRVSFVYLENLGEFKQKISQGDLVRTKYDVVIMSIGHIIGHDLYMTNLSFSNEIIELMKPRAIIIKSKTLYSLSRRLVHSQRLFDGTTKLPADMKRSSEPYIVAGVKVDEYRKTIPFVVKQTDVILEVGCHFGKTTQLLDKSGKYCIGVDIGSKIIKNAKQRYPDIKFAVGDAWKTLELIKLRKTLKDDDELGYDLVYADIGGLSGSDGYLESLSLLDSIGHALEPRCIVIKSLCMRALASKLKFFPLVWDKFQEKQKKTEQVCEEPRAKKQKT